MMSKQASVLVALLMLTALCAESVRAQVVAIPPPARYPSTTFVGVVYSGGWRPRPVSGASVSVHVALPVFDARPTSGGQPQPATSRLWQNAWTATTDARGFFSVSGLPPGPCSYTVSANRFTTANGSFMSNGGTVSQFIFLRRSLDALGTFSGRVIAIPRIRPGPIPLAANAVSSSDGAPAPAAPTDDAAAQSPDDQKLDAEDAAFAAANPVPASGAAPAAPPADLANTPAGSTFRIAVDPYPMWWGRPLAGADVTVSPMPIAIPLNAQADGNASLRRVGNWSAKTNANGQFSITGLPEGTYTYTARHPFYQPQTGTFTVNSFDPQVFRTIPLERRVSGAFAGRVTESPRILIPLDAKAPAAQPAAQPAQILPWMGTPIAGARVLVIRSRIAPPIPLPLPPIVYTANSATGANAAPAPTADASAEEKQLLEAGKDPNAGSTEPEPASADQATAGAAPAAPAAQASFARPIPPLVFYIRRAVTDGEGNFRMDRLTPGTYRFAVFAADHEARVGSFTISNRQPTAYRRIVLPRDGGIISDSGLLTGTVLYYDGRFPIDPPKGGDLTPAVARPEYPLAGATVTISRVAFGGPAELNAQYTTTTDAGGRFQMKLSAGQYTVSVSKPGFNGDQQTVYFDGAGQDLTFHLMGLFPIAVQSAQPVEAPNVTGSSVEDPFKK